MGDIKGDTRSLDYGLYRDIFPAIMENQMERSLY